MKQSKINALVLGLFILLIMLQPARAQDSENCTLIGRWPNGPCNTTFIVGSFAYIGNGGAMDIIDISDPNAPERVGQVVTPSVVHGIFVSANYAYIADGAAGLRIIDISTPSSPVEVGFFDTEGNARDVYVKNNYAYIADQYAGLRIIDISSPASPAEVGFLETGGTAREVFVQGNYAYLADYFDLYIIDISTPSSPTEVGSISTGWAFGVYVQDNYAYVANWYAGLSIVDISTPSSPTEVGSFDTGGYALSVYVQNDYAYVADGTGGLRIFNVSTPSSPTEVGHFNEEGNARAVFVQEDYAYVANFYNGLLILDVSTPSSPAEAVSVETGGKAQAIYVLNNYAYLASHYTGLNIFDVSTPTSLTEVGFLKTGDFAYDIHVVGNYAYIVDLYLGLSIIDVSTPFSPTEVGFLDTGEGGQNVYVQDNYAYVADRNSGLHIIDVGTPASPIEVGSFDTEYLYDVYVRDNYAYLASGSDGLHILDVSTPSSPTEIGISNAEGAAGVYVKDNYAYVTAWSDGLRIFDVSTPSSPTEIGQFDTEGDAISVCVVNNYAYLTDSNVGLRIIDVSTPSSPIEVGFYNTGDYAVGVYAKNNYAYLADGDDGVYILQNDLAPEPYIQNEIKLTANDGNSYDSFGRTAAIDGDYIVVGASHDDNENGIDAGAVYIFKHENNDWTQLQKIIASDGAAEDIFGYSVSINGDYIVVGAPWDDDNSEKSGSIYIFKRNGDRWTQQAKITASDAGEDNRFGIDVAISNDYVIAGAFFDDDFGTESGSAYIFKREGIYWNEQQILLAGDGAEGDWFGVSVSIDGDYAVVGSRYNDNDKGADAGAAYIFNREGTNWLERQKLTASDGAAGDLFHANSIYGDYIVVGAYQDNDKGDNSGSIYIFQRDDGLWNEMEKHTASDGEAGEMFGGSVVINGNRLVVSAYRDDDNGSNSGSLYLFQHDGVSWNEQEKVIASDGDAGDYFGLPVALDQNYILAGARNDDDNGENAGAAYLYELRLDPKIIYVPAEYSTITAAMAVANYGDTILVAPGTYPESITMKEGVVLLSEAGPTETIIATNGVSHLITGAQDAVIKGFTVADNDNGEGFPGNGIYSDGDNITICYCIIRNNRGGIYINNNSQAIVYNNTIDNNSLGGIYMQIEPAPEIYNNIISNNEGSGIFRNTAHSLGDPFIQYNCYYNNGEHFGYYGSPWIPEPGVGTLYGDPLFVGGTPFDYNLTINSPCIDIGDPTSPIDPDGTRADMGAVYYNQTTVEVNYDWPMINGNKERNSWAKSENDLYPPFGYTYEYPVAGKIATNISFFDQTLYIGTEGAPNTVYAYDFESASQLWNFEIPGTWGAIGCTPAVNDSLILFGGQDGLGLYALDRLTGAQRWLTEIGSLYQRNPVVDDDLIYLVKDTMRCIYVEDGSKRWSFYLPDSKGTPTLDQEFVYFVGHNHLMKIYKRTGAIRSSITNKGYTIVVDDLSRYTCSTDSIISRDKATGSRNWYYKISGVEAAGTGNIIAVDDNYLCVSVWATGELHVLNKTTGAYLWHYTFSDVGVYTPTIANGIVYVVNGDPHEGGPGTLWGFDLSSGNNIFYDDSEDYRGQPIVANHTLFVPAVGKVKAFRNMAVAVEQESSQLSPENYYLSQNYPNPFNPVTKIQFAVKEPGRVVLKVYDLLGREIAKLANEHYQAGQYQLKFDGSGLPSGIYFYKIQIGDYRAVKKMVLLE